MRLFRVWDRRTSRKAVKQRNRVIFFIMLVLFLGIVFLGLRFLGSFQALQNTEPWAKALRDNSQDEGTNYLFYGIEETEDERFIEEIFFINVRASSDVPHLVFIPGNMLLHRFDEKEKAEDVLGSNSSEENGLTSYYTPANFYQDGGAKLLVNQLSSFLGVPIHHFLEFRYEGIPVLIDARGGISYKGYVLKGKDYLEYFLHGEGGEDVLGRALGRTRSLQDLVEFAAQKKGILSTPRLLKKVSPYLNTDLSWKELKEFYPLLELLSAPETLVVQLPGDLREINGEPFFEPNYEQIAFLMENLGEDFILPRDLITVEVLNGCGTQGVASQMADLLRSKGFQIDEENVGNADNFDYGRTQVISRLDDTVAAKQVAETVGGVELIKEPVVNYPVMVTVIIGKDFSL
jgi:anionic cell wall polymer biosynthesis LytR-Cps2A-Psr (LCP) family protein